MTNLNKKFVVTLDKATADKLIGVGFKLISHQGAAYTFLNQPPKNFNFEQFDSKQVHYTNMLSI